jgi:hypothetical protein
MTMRGSSAREKQQQMPATSRLLHGRHARGRTR